MRVVVALDPTFGAGRSTLAADAFWFVESLENRALAETLWRTGGFDPNSAVFDDPAPQAKAVDVLFDVLEHHPDWDAVEVVGQPLDDDIQRAFGEHTGAGLVATENGFIICRKPPNP